MPQLMPLNWIFSSMMVLLMMICAGIVFSEVMKMYEVKYNGVSSINNKLFAWCW